MAAKKASKPTMAQAFKSAKKSAGKDKPSPSTTVPQAQGQPGSGKSMGRVWNEDAGTGTESPGAGSYSLLGEYKTGAGMVNRHPGKAGRGGQGSPNTNKPAQPTGRSGQGAPNTNKPGQPTGRGGRTGEPFNPKWTDVNSPDFPGWKKLPLPDTTPKGRGKQVPPKSGGRSKGSGGSGGSASGRKAK